MPAPVTQQTVAELFNKADALQQSLPRERSFVNVPLFRVLPASAEDGELVYTAIKLPDQTHPQTVAPSYPSRIAKVQMRGVEAIRSFLEGPGSEAWSYRDSDVWAELQSACAELNLSGQESRKLSEAVALAVLARRGAADVKPWSLVG